MNLWSDLNDFKMAENKKKERHEIHTWFREDQFT